MGETGQEQVIAGIAAAEGLAIGTLVLDSLEPCGTRNVGTREAERQALGSAIDRAKADLERLIDSEDKLAAEILEFQAALLEDEDLIDPILASLAEGQAAHDAWGQALDREIAELLDSSSRVIDVERAEERRGNIPRLGPCLSYDSCLHG